MTMSNQRLDLVIRAALHVGLLAGIFVCLTFLGWGEAIGMFRSSASADLSPDPEEQTATASNALSVISDGEELVYEVSWWPFKLGQIRINTRVTHAADGSLRPTAVAHIDSYGNLPFVDVHTVSETEMDSSLYSLDAKSVEKKGNEWWSLRHHFNPATKQLIIEDSWSKTPDSPPYKPPTFDTLVVHGELQDGLSILFYTRSRLHSKKSFRFPTIVYKKLGQTTLHFTDETSNVGIDAYPEPIATKGFTGLAEFEGLFGLSGEFEGWFSNDAAAVPIKAKLGVIVGKIDIELIEWKHSGWTPPHEKD
jgi:hypothetical protein